MPPLCVLCHTISGLTLVIADVVMFRVSWNQEVFPLCSLILFWMPRSGLWKQVQFWPPADRAHAAMSKVRSACRVVVQNAGLDCEHIAWSFLIVCVFDVMPASSTVVGLKWYTANVMCDLIQRATSYMTNLRLRMLPMQWLLLALRTVAPILTGSPRLLGAPAVSALDAAHKMSLLKLHALPYRLTTISNIFSPNQPSILQENNYGLLDWHRTLNYIFHALHNITQLGLPKHCMAHLLE